MAGVLPVCGRVPGCEAMLRPDYRFCSQTVTVYNAYGPPSARQYKRTVIVRGAFLDHNRQWKENRRGVSAASPFLLVIPQGAGGQTYVPHQTFTGAEGSYTLAKGDKVLEGEGPEIATAAEWAALIPASVAGLVVIGSVDAKRGPGGKIVHIEGGS